jgi:hypothetical protein
MKKLTMLVVAVCLSFGLFVVPVQAQYGVQQMGDTTFIYNYNTGQTFTVQNLPGSGPSPQYYPQQSTPKLNLTFPDPGAYDAGRRAGQEDRMREMQMRQKRGW